MAETENNSKNKPSEKSFISVSQEQLPACCPPKDQDQWNLHPRVYLELSSDGKANCPYCGNEFRLAQ